MPVKKVSWEQAIAWRLGRHHLDRRAPRSKLLDVASGLCGLHAQLTSSAELTLWARVDGLEAGDVARALWEERTLFKSWAMRGTLHLLPSSEYSIWQGGWSTFDHYKKGAWFKAFGIDLEQLQAIVEAIGAALDGAILTREELAAEVARITGSPELEQILTGSWGSALKPAAFQGKLCFGPDLGRNVRFTNPAWWLGTPSPMESEDALDAITRQFLGSFAPATRDDYARWWFCTPAKAAVRLKRLGDDAVEVDVEGSLMWMLASQVEALAGASVERTVNLLPAFDQYVIAATRHVERLLPDPGVKARIYRPQGWISPVVLVDGRMEGVWQFEKKPGRFIVKVESFGTFDPAVKEAIQQEAESLARFMGAAEVQLEFVA